MTTTTVKERPILCSSPMVRAILAGRKTQTRRIVKPQPESMKPLGPRGAAWPYRVGREVPDMPGHRVNEPIRCPYSPGTRLWVREAWAYNGGNEYLYQQIAANVQYRATHDTDHRVKGLNRIMGKPDGDDRWRPSIHMPRWASRIDLEVTGVRVERVQEASHADIAAEGVLPGEHPCEDAMRYWHEAWTRINGQASWDENPWVWVVEFRRIRP